MYTPRHFLYIFITIRALPSLSIHNPNYLHTTSNIYMQLSQFTHHHYSLYRGRLRGLTSSVECQHISISEVQISVWGVKRVVLPSLRLNLLWTSLDPFSPKVAVSNIHPLYTPNINAPPSLFVQHHH